MILTDAKIKRARQITNVFENSTTEFEYSYAEKLDDFSKRGVTVGLGFVVRMDLIQVLNFLSIIDKSHSLLHYIEHTRNAMKSSFYNRWQFPVKQFIKDWNELGGNTTAIRAQEFVYKDSSIQPALDICEKHKLTNFWSFVTVFDCCVMNGLETDEDTGVSGCEDIAALTSKTIFTNEKGWVKNFNIIRSQVMEDSGDDEWQKALNRPIYIREFADQYWNDYDAPMQLDFKEYGSFEI